MQIRTGASSERQHTENMKTSILTIAILVLNCNYLPAQIQPEKSPDSPNTEVKRTQQTPLLTCPGYVAMRCISTIDTTDPGEPLIIIDNFPFKGSMKDLNIPASEIKSIHILKDAAAASIWGAQARAGVIVIERVKKDSLKEKISKVAKARFTDSAKIFRPNSIVLTPNPAKDKIRILMKDKTNAFSVSLINMQGQTLRTWKNTNESVSLHEFDITGLPSGTYVAIIKTVEKITAEKILISQ